MDIQIAQFYNENTLNIFSDASMFSQLGCYGVVAVVKDNIIDSTYRLVSNTTSNNSEIKGIRAALDLALKYKDRFQFINIFSDSLISVNGLRDYIYNWKYNKNDGLLYSTAKKPVANQEIFIEAHRILNILEAAPCIIHLYHQAGHVDKNYNCIRYAADKFKKMNDIHGNIDLNFIRYISTWNNHVDINSRSMVRRNKNNETEYKDAFVFYCPDGKL